MANFEPKKLTKENINKGQRYQNGDGVDAEAINAPIESALWVQNLAVEQPNVIVDSKATTISVTIQNPDNQPYFQFTFPEFITERKLRDRSIELIDTKEVFAETFSFNAGTTVTYLYADPNDSDDYELYLPSENGTLATREWTDEKYAPKPYRHIETITLTEDTNIISINQEPNGAPYNFKELLVLITNTDGNTGNAYFDTFNNSGVYANSIAYYLLNYKRAYAKMKVSGGFVFLECHSGVGDYSNFQGYSRPIQADKIVRLKIRANGTFKTGTVFEIYAIDKE